MESVFYWICGSQIFSLETLLIHSIFLFSKLILNAMLNAIKLCTIVAQS